MSNGEATIGSPQVVKLKRKLLAAYMTCPLCQKLLRDATAISECLHTFCRKCILDNLADEDADCCPICNIDLGCVPVEKLRPDYNLQDIITKIFPYKRRKEFSLEVLPLMTLPIRRKERSLSSLVVDTPLIGSQTRLLRKTKAAARRVSTGEHVEKDWDNSEHLAGNSSSLKSASKMSHSRRQNSSNGETSNHAPSNDNQNNREVFVDKSSLPSPATKADKTVGFASDCHVHKAKIREHSSKSKFQDVKYKNVPASSEAVEVRRVQCADWKRKVLRPSGQAVLDASDVGSERRISPIWLSLVSLPEREGDIALPQISASYLRIKEGNLPVTFLQKYLVKKLNLASEAEAEHILATEDLFRPFFGRSDDVDYQFAINKYEHMIQDLSLTTHIRDYRVQGVAAEHMSQDMTAQTTDMGVGPSTYTDLGPSSFPESTQSPYHMDSAMSQD